MDAKQTPSSCRNGTTVHLVTCNGTLVPVKAAISHHAGTTTQAPTWSISCVRSSDAAAADERRLRVRIAGDGSIVSVSKGTPSSLYGIDPAELVGKRIDTLVDVAWHHVKAGEPGGVGSGGGGRERRRAQAV